MGFGKAVCNFLKNLREEIANKNGIEYDEPQCTHEGECNGTCPYCEAKTKELTEVLKEKERNGEKVDWCCGSCNCSSVNGGECEELPDIKPLMDGYVDMDLYKKINSSVFKVNNPLVNEMEEDEIPDDMTDGGEVLTETLGKVGIDFLNENDVKVHRQGFAPRVREGHAIYGDGVSQEDIERNWENLIADVNFKKFDGLKEIRTQGLVSHDNMFEEQGYVTDNTYTTVEVNETPDGICVTVNSGDDVLGANKIDTSVCDDSRDDKSPDESLKTPKQRWEDALKTEMEKESDCEAFQGFAPRFDNEINASTWEPIRQGTVWEMSFDNLPHGYLKPDNNEDNPSDVKSPDEILFAAGDGASSESWSLSRSPLMGDVRVSKPSDILDENEEEEESGDPGDGASLSSGLTLDSEIPSDILQSVRNFDAGLLQGYVSKEYGKVSETEMLELVNDFHNESGLDFSTSLKYVKDNDYDIEKAKQKLTEDRVEMIRNLRNESGHGMALCKKALYENDWNITKAKQWLSKYTRLNPMRLMGKVSIDKDGDE